MEYISKNFGLAGGMLDATKHVEAAMERLLTAEEQAQCYRCQLATVVTSQSHRDAAPTN
jgi:hypothetical protein